MFITHLNNGLQNKNTLNKKHQTNESQASPLQLLMSRLQAFNVALLNVKYGPAQV